MFTSCESSRSRSEIGGIDTDALRRLLERLGDAGLGSMGRHERRKLREIY
jgi:hypothetical protein